MDLVGPFSETSFQVTYGHNAFGRWENGDPSIGRAGSIPGVESWTHATAELVHLIEYSGQVPDRADLQQVRKAISSMISALTGGGDTSEYLLLSQAQARLPIFPEILSADGKINVSSPAAGTILIPPTVAIQHRGIFPLSTSDYTEDQRIFATAPNRTYHLRWTLGTGFALRDLADGGYNPAGLSETDAIFDSTYDDMLVSRVVTNASGHATVTNLVNRHRLKAIFSKTSYQSGDTWIGLPGLSARPDWARTPEVAIRDFNFDHDSAMEMATSVMIRSISRYAIEAFAAGYDARTGPGRYISGFIRLSAWA